MLPIITGIAGIVGGICGIIRRIIDKNTDKMRKGFKESNLNLSNEEVDKMFLNKDM